MFLAGTVPKKHSTVVISETVRETGTLNGVSGELIDISRLFSSCET